MSRPYKLIVVIRHRVFIGEADTPGFAVCMADKSICRLYDKMQDQVTPQNVAVTAIRRKLLEMDWTHQWPAPNHCHAVILRPDEHIPFP